MTTNKELIERLNEYADNPGYGHGDYADTMREAATALAAQVDAAPAAYEIEYEEFPNGGEKRLCKKLVYKTPSPMDFYPGRPPTIRSLVYSQVALDFDPYKPPEVPKE